MHTRELRLLAACIGIVTTAAVASDSTRTGFWVPAIPPAAQYRIDLRVNVEDGRVELDADETIRFTNSTERPIQRLAIEWAMGWPESLEVYAGGDALDLVPAALDESGAPALLSLPHPADPGDVVQLDIAFPPTWEGGAARCMKLAGWYPRLWWGFPTHDDYDVQVDAPPEYAVGTSGRLDPDTQRYVVTGARSFAVFLGKGLQVLDTSAEDVGIRVIHTAKGEASAKLLLETAKDAVNFYREYFGSYPYPTLTIIPGMDRPAGGYPVATAVVAIHGQERMADKPELHWRWIAAHEIGHQYWGERVLEKDSPGWLSIGLGIHADREYVRARNLGLEQHRQLVARYTEGVERGLNTTLAPSPEHFESMDYDYNNVSIHGKGFAVVSALACVLGEDTFHRVCVRCLDEYAGRRLGAHEFQTVCEQESGEDLAWFFNQWVRSNRYLSYEIASQSSTIKDGTHTTHVHVKSNGTLRMPVPVAATFEDGTAQVKHTDRLLTENDIVFESAAPLEDVRLDPEGCLAMARSQPSSATTIEPIIETPMDVQAELRKRIEALPWTGAGREPFDLFFVALDVEPRNAELWGKLALTLYDGEFYDEALDAFEHAAKMADPGALWAFTALVWQGHVLDIMERREEAVERYEKALDHNAGDGMRHDQYHMKVDRAWALERIEKPFVRE